MVSQRDKISDIFLYFIETNDLSFHIDDEPYYYNSDCEISQFIPVSDYNDVMVVNIYTKNNIKFNCKESINIINKLSNDYKIIQPIIHSRRGRGRIKIYLISNIKKNYYCTLALAC